MNAELSPPTAAMSFIVVGAGAVGSVLGGLLENAGHAVAYWLRPARPPLAPFALRRAAGPIIQTPAPRCVSAHSEPKPGSDWLLVCVRTEQLTAALQEVAAQLGPARAVAIASVTIDGALHCARAAGMTGPVLALHVSFGAYHHADPHSEIAWFPFSLRTTISCEGQPQLGAAANALAQQLDRAGLPTRSRLTMRDSMRFLVATNSVLLPAWELCGWDIRRLAGHAELRHDAASAMHEAARLLAPASGFARRLWLALPVAVYGWVIRLLPLLMGARAQELWRQHGPKLRAQTDYVLGDLLERARRQERALPALTRLYARWREH
jgi:ketopantoate reductase